MKKFFLIAVFVSLSFVIRPQVVFSQDSLEAVTSIWTDFFFSQTISNNFRYLIHSNYKVAVYNGKWRQFMVRPALIFRPGDVIQLQAGFNFFHTSNDDIKLYEFRTWQGINIFLPKIKNVYVNNFIRLEQRFFYQSDGEKIYNALRGRYALMAFIPLWKKDIVSNTVYLWPYAELFVNLAGNDIQTFLTRERVSIGIGYAFTTTLRTELVYMHEWARLEKDNAFESVDHVFRIVLRYFISHNSNYPIN